MNVDHNTHTPFHPFFELLYHSPSSVPLPPCMTLVQNRFPIDDFSAETYRSMFDSAVAAGRKHADPETNKAAEAAAAAMAADPNEKPDEKIVLQKKKRKRTVPLEFARPVHTAVVVECDAEEDGEDGDDTASGGGGKRKRNDASAAAAAAAGGRVGRGALFPDGKAEDRTLCSVFSFVS